MRMRSLLIDFFPLYRADPAHGRVNAFDVRHMF